MDELTSAAAEENSPHAATFTYPTLELDGSLADFASTSAQAHISTPLAGLSSQGATLKMSNDTMSESSLADSQYDMVDDLSEMSGDDHETASLASTEQGQMTPHDDEDFVHAMHFKEILRATETAQDAKVSSHLPQENELSDSYISENLETPRQSTWRDTIMRSFDDRLMSNATAQAAATTSPFDEASQYRILFMSDINVTVADINNVSIQIAALLRHAERVPGSAVDQGLHIKQIDFRPMSPSALHVERGDVDLLSLHCTDAKCYTHPTSSEPVYRLVINSLDPRTRSHHSFDPHNDTDFARPSLAVYYLTEPGSYPSWFSVVKDALKQSGVPSITIKGDFFNVMPICEADEAAVQSSDIIVTSSELFAKQDESLRARLRSLVASRTEPSDLNQGCREGALMKSTDIGMLKTRSATSAIFPAVICLLGVLLGLLAMGYIPTNLDANEELNVRRSALSTAIATMTKSNDVLKTLNVEHLLPSTNETLCGALEHRGRSQGLSPNHIIVSVPRKTSGRRHPRLVSTQVSKAGGRRIEFNSTKLLDGVYFVKVRNEDAFDLVTVIMRTASPALELEFSHNFGNKLFQRRTYQKATTEVSKTVNKDLAVARRNMRSLQEKVGIELGASVIATKNVTTQLASYVRRDLQVLANTAMSVFVKAAAAGSSTVTTFRKDFVLVQRDIIALRNDVVAYGKHAQLTLRSLAKAGKEMHVLEPISFAKKYARSVKEGLLSKPLAISRERAQRFRDRFLVGRTQQETNNTSASATKELSLRLQNLIPGQHTKDTGSLSDIARCARAEDYRACRRAQKALVLANPSPSAATQISTTAKISGTSKTTSTSPRLSPTVKYSSTSSRLPPSPKLARTSKSAPVVVLPPEGLPPEGKKPPRPLHAKTGHRSSGLKSKAKRKQQKLEKKQIKKR